MDTAENRKTSMKKINEVNLLLLGATGVGKSTFINAIANYLTYGSLEEALKGTPVNLIPLQFATTDEDYKTRKIEMGAQDDNENLEAGKSATQGARTYRFQIADILVRCIDTPGIGDVRGKDQDKVNFEFIMRHLNYIKEINAICIFIDPNSPRLTEYFTFCMDELLTHLHKDACKNIVFIFCKSRSTNYKPGDSLPTLIQLIKEKNYNGINPNKDTIYCIDNESVRLLAMHANGMKLDELDMVNCSFGWGESSKAIGRLINHVSSLPPHLIKNTVCLNEAKNMVYALIEPMLQICENIDKNIDLLKKKRSKAAGWKDGDASKPKLNMPKIVLEPKNVNPRLVCAGNKCVEKVMVDGSYIEKYAQVCHEDCYIRGLKFLNKISSLNRLCEVMNEGVCTKCWCSWELHKHITCDYEEKIVENAYAEDSKSSPQQRETETSDIAEFIARLDENVRMQDGERDKIIDIAAKLGIFLHQNSIRMNSDVIVEQIKQSIVFEETIVKSGGTEAKGRYLKSLLEKYELQKSQLSEVRVFPSDVNYMINTLYNLPLNGPTIERSVKATLNANEQNCLKTEIVLACRGALSLLHNKLSSQIAHIQKYMH